jgi:glycosyltransferase involved in cell wall biosynthesis
MGAMRKAGARKVRTVFYLNVLLVIALICYKIYLNFFELDFGGVHAAQVERIEAVLAGKDGYRFAVVGNINNSIGIFERKITPMLNRSGVDFVVSAGNAVSSGGEDKYRALYRTLSRLHMPYLITFGENEESRLGGFRFYDHFGPYLFSFAAANTRFVFLDSTGKSDYQWQLRWLEEDLAANTARIVFVFSGHPLKPVPEEGPFDFDRDYLFDEEVRGRFEDLIERSGVDAVFSANLPLFSDQRHQDTRYVLTGGAGGFVPDSEHGFYHYVEVAVDGDRIRITPERLDIGQHPFWRTLESFWFFVHSLFYVGYLNFVLLISSLIMVATWLYTKVFVDRDYYPDFDIDPEPFLNRHLRVAMFTNNYLPFIGGVPLSIERLRRGLVRRGHRVLIVAPAYRGVDPDEEDTIRVGSLLPIGRQGDLRLANIFSVRLYRGVLGFRPDLIHVHHPFWLGSAGRFLARRLGIPVVYTYHTRLEHFAHSVPLPGPLFRNLVSHALVRRFANRCDAIVVPTESAEEYLRIIGVKRPIFVQPTGIDYERFQEVPDEAIRRLRSRYGLGEERILISISRLSKEKNLEFLLDAVGALVRACPVPFRFLLIGDGEERERLRERIDAEGLSKQVLLVGAVPPEEIPAYCRLADVFLFASRAETQGMVILEAMAAGLPVVAVRSSGIHDIIQDGVNGFKTPPDPARWCERVIALLTDRDLHARLSANARTVAEGYRIEQFSGNIAKVYAHALAGRAEAGAKAIPPPRRVGGRVRQG